MSDSSQPSTSDDQESKPRAQQLRASLLLATLGVVYGDIGTSPLYAMRECFHGAHGLEVSAQNIFGILSLVFWSLMLIVSLKYVVFILRAENNHEGGVLALVALANTAEKIKSTFHTRWITVLGLFGAALLYGDGMITPAISVLSAVEGLTLLAPGFQPYITFITAGILIGLFAIQSQGTARIGRYFGPIMLLWFLTLGVMGVLAVIKNPAVLAALNPWYGVKLLLSGGWQAFVVLGAVFLSVTGAEALYADMGHFGRRPIQFCWFGLVLPSLVLNYFGQGALLLQDPSAAANPFYLLMPKSLLFFGVGIATAATILASQAMISGVFSLTRQAIQLGFVPRTKIVHTSEEEIGQIYLPRVNWWLLVATLILVFSFKTSANLASAYGIAVSLTMVITTVIAAAVLRYAWNWSRWQAWAVTIFFLAIDLGFLTANFTKIFQGGALPLLIGIAGCLCMVSWRKGRALLSDRLYRQQLPLKEFIRRLQEESIMRVPGAAVFLGTNSGNTPAALSHTVKLNKSLLERIVVMSLVTEGVPYVAAEQRLEVEEIGHGIHKVVAHLGFLDTPNVPRLLRAAAKQIPGLQPTEVTYYLGRETLVPGRESALPRWQRALFMFLSRNAENAAVYFRLPSDRVIEVGTQVKI